ncbi:MAG TPA: DUF1295 domain-containing protein [Candidatus Paceibacterota bacterium]
MELLTAAGTLFVYMCIAFIVSLVRKDNGTADIAYGWGFALVAWVTFFLGTQSVLGFVLSAIATVWAARLSIRIYLRNRGKPEDFRYKKWREEWGKTFVLRSFLQVYMLQGLVIFLVSLPVALTNLFADSVAEALMPLAAFGIFAWLVGFYFEAVGDYQLARFLGKPENKGKVMDQGLWRYTRHPNYFGESLMWWGIAIASCAALLSMSATLALAGFVSPILITYLLLKVSGVPMLEARFAGNPEWEAYKKRTSVFIPLPPKGV